MRSYLAVGATVFVANVVFHTVWPDSISTVEHKVDDISVDVKDIKQAILEVSPNYVKYTKSDVECLAKNIYWEAGVEDLVGKIAVGTVTVNRVRTAYWGHRVCDVVYAPQQFSWTHKKHEPVDTASRTWADSKTAAQAVLSGLTVRQLDKALFYHADYARPQWRDPSKRVIKIGRHIFYTQAKGTNLSL